MPPAPAPRPSATGRLLGRLAVSAVMSALVFAVLWLWALNMMTSMLLAAGFGTVIIVASSASDIIETVLDAIGSVVLGIFAAIGALIGGILGIFIN